jgi:hypothetical protein
VPVGLCTCVAFYIEISNFKWIKIRSMTIDYDVELFLSQYCVAFNLLDGERIA